MSSSITDNRSELAKERSAFQTRRLALLSSCIDVAHSVGVEVGASDLPTVPKGAGECRFADFRTADQMAEMWALPRNSICEVDYILTRDCSLSGQIPPIFDYVVACHVLEHMPDIISYINELRSLLTVGPGKVIFLTLPDKRATLDQTRPSTTIDRLLGYYYEQRRRPSFEHVLEFHRHWVGYANFGKPLPIRESYHYAKDTIESEVEDAHCHVWEDQEFLAQFEELIEGGFLPGLSIAHFEPFYVGTNEFAMILRTER